MIPNDVTLITDHSSPLLTSFIQDNLLRHTPHRIATIQELRAHTPSDFILTNCLTMGLDKSAIDIFGLDQLVEQLASMRDIYTMYMTIVVLDEHIDGIEKMLTRVGARVIYTNDTLASYRFDQIFENYKLKIRNTALEVFLDESKDGYWIWDIKNDAIEWSERTGEITGHDLSQHPRNLAEYINIVHPLDRDRVEQAINNHFNYGAPYQNIETRIRLGHNAKHKEGQDKEYGHFLINGNLIRDSLGEPNLLVGSVTDHTMMQEVEQQLEESQQLYTILFHHMNDAAALADIETGIILQANQPAERLWGRSISELVGSHQSSLHPKEITAEVQAAFRDHIDALMKNKRASIHYPILHQDGREIPTEISSSLIEIGGKTMILGVFRDITERVKAQNDLRERDAQVQLTSRMASMGTLSAGVGHEINNPLTYILGHLELLRNYIKNPEAGAKDKAEEWVDMALTGARFIREIVSDLKAISRLDSANDFCDVNEVIRIATRLALSDLRHRAHVELQLADLNHVNMSASKLSQVVINILTNAARSFGSRSEGGNHIEVHSWRQEGRGHISISDNGEGIAPNKLEKVMDPFFTTNESVGGTGLGLSICKRILNEVGGDIVISSKLGEGTRVEISLPFHEQTNQNEEEATKTPITKRRAWGLVIDDDKLVTNLLQQILATEFDVKIFNDAQEALETIDKNSPPDFIVCDLMMPNMDGWHFHQEAVRMLGSDESILFITGGAVTDANIALEKAMQEKHQLMPKPFDSAELLNRLHQLVEANDRKKATPTVAASSDAETELSKPAFSQNKVTQLMAILGDQAYADAVGQLLDQLHDEIVTVITNTEDLSAHWKQLTDSTHRLFGSSSLLGLDGIAAHIKHLESTVAASNTADTKSTVLRLQNRLEELSDISEAIADKMRK